MYISYDHERRIQAIGDAASYLWQYGCEPTLSEISQRTQIDQLTVADIIRRYPDRLGALSDIATRPKETWKDRLDIVRREKIERGELPQRGHKGTPPKAYHVSPVPTRVAGGVDDIELDIEDIYKNVLYRRRRLLFPYSCRQ